MIIHKLSDGQVNIDKNKTITIILDTDPARALKISKAELLGLIVKMCEVEADQEQIPQDLIKAIQEKIKEI